MRPGEVGLQQHLAARHGDAATRIAIEVGVALEHVEHLVHRHVAAGDLHGLVRAGLHAITARIAQFAVDDHAVRADADGTRRARRHAPVAALADATLGA